MTTRKLDQLDLAIIEALTDKPRMSVLDLSRTLQIARGTAQARLTRLQHDGVVVDFAPTVNPAAIGYPVSAFVTIEVRQRILHNDLTSHLEQISQVIEASTITGSGDVFVRVVSRDNADLQRVIDRINEHRSVIRTTTMIALQEMIPRRHLPLIADSVNTPDTGGARQHSSTHLLATQDTTADDDSAHIRPDDQDRDHI